MTSTLCGTKDIIIPALLHAHNFFLSKIVPVSHDFVCDVYYTDIVTRNLCNAIAACSPFFQQYLAHHLKRSLHQGSGSFIDRLFEAHCIRRAS